MREGWQQIHLGDVFEPDNSRLGEQTEEPTIFSISKYDGVIPADSFFGKRIASAQLDTYKVLPVDGWAYSTIHIDEGSIARNKLNHAGVVSPMYTTLRWKGTSHNPQLFEWLLREPAMLETYRANAQGSINRRRSLPWKAFSAIEIGLPSLAEQNRIVDLIRALDEAIEAADALSTSALNLSALTRERFLAELPETTVANLLTKITAGKSPTAENNPPMEGQFGVLKVSAIGPTGFRPQEAKTISDAAIFTDEMSVKANDVLITRANTAERVGMVCFVDQNYPNLFLCDKTLRLQPAPGVDPRALAFTMQSNLVRRQLAGAGTGTSGSMKNISQGDIKSLRIQWPNTVAAQLELSELVQAHRNAYFESASVSSNMRTLRNNLLSACLSREHEIPSSYDVAMGGSA